MKTVSIKHTYWDIAADIYFPDDFNSEKKYPAIISAHPIGSCKEQTSGSVYGAAPQKLVLSSLLLMPVFREAAVENRVIWKIQQCE